MTSKHTRRALVALGVALAASPAATQARPADDYPPPRDVVERAEKRKAFVGHVRGTDLLIGIAVSPGSKPIAYLCDGEHRGRWLGASKLHLARRGNAFTGRVRVGGAGRRFRAVRAVHPAGLYHGGDGPNGTFGSWVVLRDGTVAGSATKAGKPVDSTISPAEGEAVVGDETVIVGAGGGAHPQPLKKTKITREQRCAAYEKTYQAYRQNEANATTEEDKAFWRNAAEGMLQASVNAGCFPGL